jgi:O-antigen/teichoic acid export membrane protein
MNKMKKAIYNSIWITLFSVALNFGFKIFLARFISKADLALYFTSIDIFTMTLLILVGFRSSMVVSFAHTKDDYKILKIFKYVIFATVLAVWGFIIPYLKHRIGVHIDYWYLVFTVLALGLSVYYTNLIAMYRMYKTINIVTFLDPALQIVWFMIAYFLADTKGLQPLFIATIMGAFTLSFYIYSVKREVVKSVSVDKPKEKYDTQKFLKNSIMSTIEFGSGIVMMYTAVILIMRYFNLDELGDFQVVVKPIFTYMIMLFVFPIFRFVLPELSRLYGEKNFEELYAIKMWIYKFAFVVSGVFILFSLLFAQKLIVYLFSAEYAESYLMVIHISFFFIFVILNAYQISFIKANGDFLAALLIRLWGIVSLLILFFTIYNFYSKNIISVIVALIGSYISMFVVSMYKERDILENLKKENQSISL